MDSSLNPIKKDMPKTKKPWKIEMVAPPKVLPIIISILDTGAAKVSFKNPNCLSQIISIPEKTAENKTLIAIIPGVRNWM